MGLDDLSNMLLMLPLLALLVTVVVSAPASLASYVAWKWALARVADRRAVGLARALALAALAPTGGPVAYDVLLAVTLPGLVATLALALVTALAGGALVHAAYRAECIRELAKDRELSDALAGIPQAGDRPSQIYEAGSAIQLPAFVGATRRRSLVLAGIVLSAWGLVAALLG
jgi:hypothetical protein